MAITMLRARVKRASQAARNVTPATAQLLISGGIIVGALLASGCGESPSSASSAVVTQTAVAAVTTAQAEPFRLHEATIADIQKALQAKQISSVELVELYLKRIQAYNGTCVNEPEGILGPITTIPNAGQINALSTLNLRPQALDAWGFDERKARSMTDPFDNDPSMPDALEIAAALDKKFSETGELVGPLHGVVLAIKDQYDTFDMRSTSGGDVSYANDRPPVDADFITRLRDAGAIVLAKANLAEYASGGPRSSFGGTFCNPYDTERSPSISSAGSGSAVAANLVTCTIAEETGSSIRGPARANNTVGIAPTQELVSRHGMIQLGINTRTGPICRTVADTAKILDVIAGYDPKDELTVFSIGRLPEKPYHEFAQAKSLEGMRIGVVRELMNRAELGPSSDQTIDIANAAIVKLAELGAEIVDPGEGQELLRSCVRKYAPKIGNRLFMKMYPDLFPMDEYGKPTQDNVATLLDMVMDPSKVPEDFSFMTLPRGSDPGQGKFSMNQYLAERGDANVRSNADLIEKAVFHDSTQFPDRKERRMRDEADMHYDMSERMLARHMVQTTIMQCMEELKLDAMTYPSASVPPQIVGAPAGTWGGGRSTASTLGRQGFPAITVPAGFTTEVYDRVVDPDAPEGEDGRPGIEWAGPMAAMLPVGIDFVGRPFAEPTLFTIASAYEAATKHRRAPEGFEPLADEP